METTILAPQVNQIETTLDDAYLRIQLTQNTPGILSMIHAQEVLVAPVGRITAIPNMPECVLGLINWRSRVIWVVDLARMLNLQPIDTSVQQYNLAIIRVGQVPLGLAVQQVKGVTRFAANNVQSPQGLVSASLIPYLQGCILQQKEILLVLNAEAIVHSPLLQND